MWPSSEGAPERMLKMDDLPKSSAAPSELDRFLSVPGAPLRFTPGFFAFGAHAVPKPPYLRAIRESCFPLYVADGLSAPASDPQPIRVALLPLSLAIVSVGGAGLSGELLQ
jgi:hypothetical protein